MITRYEHRTDKVWLSCASLARCAPHLHGHVEVIVSHVGSADITVDAKTDVLREGDVLIAFPNQVHTYTNRPDMDGVTVLLFTPDCVPMYSRTFEKYQPEHPIIRGGLAMGNVAAMVEALRREYEDLTPGHEARMYGYLSVLLGTLLPQMSLQKIKTEGRELLPQVLAYCMEHYRENLKLSDVANALHISKYYISHLLNGRLHMGFNAYLNAVRISEAMQLLADPAQSVTEVAIEVGFDSLRTFDRAFRAQTRMSPRAWRIGTGTE